MGSLFYINVPTREYEVILRQKALQIKVEKEVENVNKDLLASRLQISDARLGREKRDSTASNKGQENVTDKDGGTGNTAGGTDPNTSNRASIGSSTGSTVDVYEALVNGEKANIVVSQDSMIIYPRASSLKDDKDRKLSPAAVAPMKRNSTESTFLEKHVEDALSAFQIYDATWGQSVDGNFSQISFTVQDFRTESIINFLLNLGIGTKYDSTLTVCSATIYYNPNKQEAGRATEGEEKRESSSFGQQFIASIKSRLTVAQVVQSVQANAIITFDYILLLCIAGTIAALGLLENSSVNLVASMLISPLMGPIMAGCFGAVVRDKKLVKTGVVSELIGLSICLAIGFIFGVCVTSAPFSGPWASLKHWPTDEMLGRGKARSIAVGAFVAIPSGAGVALSILAGNAGSLVGVAISASLLPPAVNCGMFLGMSAVITIKLQIAGHNPYSTPCDSYVGDGNSTDHLFRLTRDGYNVNDFYCKNVVMEYGILGIVSFGLTMVNIVLILITGFLILKLKEVAPHTTRKTMDRFWKEDLRVMREYNKTHGSFNKQAILAEIGGTHNAAEIRAKLVNDSVFNQVTRRNVFGNQIGAQELLEAQTFSSSDAIQTTASLEHTHSTKPSGGGWWGSWLPFGGSKEKVEPTPKPSKMTTRPHFNKRV